MCTPQEDILEVCWHGLKLWKTNLENEKSCKWSWKASYLPLLAVSPTDFLLSSRYLWSACSISILHSCLSSFLFHHGSPQNPQLLLVSTPLYSALGCLLNFTTGPFFRDWAGVETKFLKSPLVSPNHTEIAGNSVCKVWKAGWERCRDLCRA